MCQIMPAPMHSIEASSFDVEASSSDVEVTSRFYVEASRPGAGLRNGVRGKRSCTGDRSTGRRVGASRYFAFYTHNLMNNLREKTVNCQAAPASTSYKALRLMLYAGLVV